MTALGSSSHAARSVLLLSPDYPPRVSGGVGTHVHDLATRLARRGWDVTVVTPGPRSRPVARREDGVEVVRIRYYDEVGEETLQLRHRALSELCVRLARQKRVDLVHVHDPFFAPVSEAVSRQTGLPLLLTQHNCFHAILERVESGKDQALPAAMTELRSRERRSLDVATAAICVSSVVADELRAAGGPLPPLHVVPNGVDVEAFAGVEPRQAARVRATLAAPDQRLVLFAGRAHGIKGLPELIIAAGMVRDEAPQARFAFLLCTSEPAAIAALRSSGIGADGVVFLDNVPRVDMPAHFAAADVVAMPSRWEPFGLVALEAMAAARPLLVSDAAPLNEIVRDGVTGRVVPRVAGPRGVVDARALARILVELLRMPAESLAAMGRRGQNRVRALYSLERMVETTTRVYRQVAGARRPAPRSTVRRAPAAAALPPRAVLAGS